MGLAETVYDDNDIEITPEFSDAFDLLENTSENVFITGKAGTGKSTFLEYFRSNSRKNIAVVAPTGVAALNVHGQTIHSFFQFKPRLLDLQHIGRKKNNKIYSKIDVLVIDEISMVRADIFDGIEKFLRLNGKNKGEPFGGVQLCVIGDLFQLPPIVSQSEEEAYYEFYDSPFFFCTESYEEANFHIIELEHIFRQKDNDFITILNRIRHGDNSQHVLQYINQCATTKRDYDTTPITLTTTNRIAENINRKELAHISNPTFTYEGKVEGNFVVNGDKLPAPESLELKEGAQVMFVKNDPTKRWVNGTIGTVTELSEDTIIVTLHKDGKDRNYKVKRETWESITYELNEETGKVEEKVVGSYVQYPLIHAWAVTIHKSQGKTLDSAIIDLGWGAFAPGQLYVALSRCRDFNSITLKRPVAPKDIQCDERVIGFTESVA